MSDQAPTQVDTPGVAGPAGGQTEGTDDWHARYVNLEADHTRAAQEAAQLRDERDRWEQERQLLDVALTSDDEDLRRQALDALGYELPQPEYTGDEGFEPADQYSELASQIQGLQERLDRGDTQAKEAQDRALIDQISRDRLNAIEGLDPADHDLVFAYAINALPALRERDIPVPLPDIQGAWEHFRQREDDRQKTWAQTKPAAPYARPGGLPATEVPDTGTHQGRVDAILQKMGQGEGMT